VPVVFAGIAGAALIVLMVIIRVVNNRKPGRPPTAGFQKSTVSPVRFQQYAKEAGFLPKEGLLLYDLARQMDSENPLALLTSLKRLDAAIKMMMDKLSATGKEKDSAGQEFVGKMMEHRKRLTNEKLSAQPGLTDSRGIPVGQNVQVVLANMGVFSTRVQATGQNLAILSPIIMDLPPDFKWENKKVILFFRRKNDGEYSFGTSVVKEVGQEKAGDTILLLRHQDTLSRAQRRQSLRMMMHKNAHLYPVGNSAGRTFSEGMRCVMNDLSDGGCSVILEGKIEMPRTAIIQTTLGGRLISLVGECRAIQYNRAKNVSLLHIETPALPREIKNLILAVMFGIITDSADPDTADAPSSATPAQADPENQTGNGQPDSAQENVAALPPTTTTDPDNTDPEKDGETFPDVFKNEEEG
jgi:hypothetical protein